ncbi:MAG: hypothetical protein HQ502_12305 [Alphaproteobacteria bacterium]|nr:hypothetical protein [Alphaproteobacteria bacterium]
MSLQSLEINLADAPYGTDGVITNDRGERDRRATARAGINWRNACEGTARPRLAGLNIGDAADWKDCFIIRCDNRGRHAIIVACGDTLQSDWQMDRPGGILEDILPDHLCDKFAEGCERSLTEGRPIHLEDSYQDRDQREILFRSVMMPVRADGDDIDFIYGAYSHKINA